MIKEYLSKRSIFLQVEENLQLDQPNEETNNTYILKYLQIFKGRKMKVFSVGLQFLHSIFKIYFLAYQLLTQTLIFMLFLHYYPHCIHFYFSTSLFGLQYNLMNFQLLHSFINLKILLNLFILWYFLWCFKLFLNCLYFYLLVLFIQIYLSYSSRLVFEISGVILELFLPNLYFHIFKLFILDSIL